AGADMHARHVNQGTPLHFAAATGSVKVARLLLNSGVDKDARSASGRTPLQSAAEKGHIEVVRLLLTHGAKKDVQNKDEATALDLAVQGGHVDVVTLLRDHGVDRDVYTEEQPTPLHLPVQNGHVEVAGLRHLVSPNLAMNDTCMEDDDAIDINPIDIEVPPHVIEGDICDYSKKFLYFCGYYVGEDDLSDVAGIVQSLSGGNFSTVILVNHLIKLSGAKPTTDFLEGLSHGNDNLTVPEHLLFLILQKYRDTLDVDFYLLVNVLRALSLTRTAAMTLADLAMEVMDTKTDVALVLRQLEPLVTIRRLSTTDGVEAPATSTLFSSLMAKCVNRLDETGYLDELLDDLGVDGD
ncbi:hypothetical protein HK405_004633, partial [Cladochytrium tenue]